LVPPIDALCVLGDIGVPWLIKLGGAKLTMGTGKSGAFILRPVKRRFFIYTAQIIVSKIFLFSLFALFNTVAKKYLR
jgi:hypothetical protein